MRKNDCMRKLPYQQVFCSVCDKDIPRGLSSLAEYQNRKFCSMSCVSFGRKADGTFKGDRNPRYKGIVRNCLWCYKPLKWNKPSIKYHRQCMGLAQMGANNPNWKNGATSENEILRASRQSKDWRKKVFERDDFTCQICGDNKGGNLNAHHIKRWRDYPELRFTLSNGVTLCVQCHIEVHKHN